MGLLPEVPGLAIAQLSRIDGIPAVLVSRWEWDGATRTQVERPVATVMADGPGETEDLQPNGEAPWGTPSSGT